MIRVLHVIARLNVGGAALHVISLADRLRAPGMPAFDSQIVCGVVGPNEADMGYVAAEKAVPVTIIRELGRELSLRGDLVTTIKLWRVMRRQRPDIVHTHTAKAGFVGRIAARAAGVPVVVHTFHGHVFHGYFGPRKTQVFLNLERLCARLSDRIIVPSTELKRQIAEQYRVCSADKIDVIGVGLELDKLAALPRHTGNFRAEQNIPVDAPLIGIVGRLVPIKNHDLFLHAVRIVLDRQPDAYFALIGDGERRAELTAMAESLGLTERVRFTGWITDVAPVYSALDTLALCSHNEGLPISVIEAMAARVPVAATNVGGISDLLPDPRLGALVPPGNATALAEGLLNGLHGHYDLEAARSYVLAHYDMAVLAAQTAALYRRLWAAQRHSAVL
ncbi:MAG: glycosyltransferase family 4 protein [Aggregatilineales bacterium]